MALAAANAEAQETRRVVVGAQYEAGAATRLWFGGGYRDLWTTPIELPVLDLVVEAGGLTPVRVVGQAQSLGLALRGADGRSYTFRSLHKHPERMLPEIWRDRWPGRFLQDQTSGTHPGAALVLAPLFQAIGIPGTGVRLVVMPDDGRLGRFREQFAGAIGTIELFPTAGFMGASEIISTRDLWQRWRESPSNRIDSRALLRARLVDLLVDNYDRHAGQWRWMRRPESPIFQPLPEDPDFVLVRHDGLVGRAIRARMPQYMQFSARYPRSVEGSLRNNYEVDRWLQADLDAAAWDETARDVVARLTDEVIEKAARALPPEVVRDRRRRDHRCAAAPPRGARRVRGAGVPD